MEGEEGERLQVFEDEIAVAGGVDGVGGGRAEFELAGGDSAIEREGGAGDGSGAEGAKAEAVGAILETRRVAEQHFDVREEPVGDEDWLGSLEVGVGGHNGFARGMGLRDKMLCPGGEVGEQHLGAKTDVEAEVGGDLLVAAAAGVELEGEVADRVSEAELDEVVDVFGLGVVADLVRPRRVVGSDGLQRADDLGAVVVGEDTGGAKRERMRPAGGQLFPEQLPVEADRALPLVEEGIGGRAKAARPHFGGLFGGLFGHERYSPFAVALLSRGISEPWLRVIRPLWA